MTLTKARREALVVLLAAQRQARAVQVARITFAHPGFPSTVNVRVARWLRDNGHVVTDPDDVLDLATDHRREVTIHLTDKGRRLAERWEGST